MGIYNNVKQSITRHLVDCSLLMFPTTTGTVLPGSANEGETYYKTDTMQLYHRENSAWVEKPLDWFYLDFDGHADIEQFPTNDLIGIQAFGFELDGQLLMADLNIGISVFEDINLYNHDRMMDKLLGYFLPNTEIPYYDLTAGVKQATPLFVHESVTVFPMAKANNRPVQFINLRMIIADAYSLT